MIFRFFLGLYFAVILINLQSIGLVSSANQIEKSLLFVAGLAFVLTRKVDRFNVICVTLIMLTTVACAFLTSYNQFDLGRYFKSAFSLLSIFMLLLGIPLERDRTFLLRLCAWTPVVCVGLGILYNAAGIHTLWYTDFLGVTRLQAASIPAGLGSFGYIGSVAAILCAVFFDKRYFALTITNLVILLLSAARMPLALALGICLVVYFSFYARSLVQAYLSVFALVIVGASAFFSVGTGILNRFESNSLSGRDLLWEALDQVLNQYPWFGIGLGHQITVVPDEVMVKAATIAAHNEYLRVALETGYIGACLIFSIMALIFVRYLYLFAAARSLMYISLVASFFIYCKTDNAISSGVTPFILVLAVFNFARPQAYLKAGGIKQAPSRNLNSRIRKSAYLPARGLPHIDYDLRP
ncbi:O-antigen ligase [Rhizobium sp. BK650]|uniref:O-antigen ligase family protein n=1 Tax=Rhizobium sp. BK650 TaxID=2586990 RepID=UPI00160F377B|nr:O-antigen ligase family protein [Rhizobium sp. BK650]MBB3659240.1 O-antigen ligase [Rhizobium sp. BK650]